MKILINQNYNYPKSINHSVIIDAVDKFVLSKKFFRKTELKKLEVTNKYYEEKIKQNEKVLEEAELEEKKLRNKNIELDSYIKDLIKTLKEKI